MKGINQFLNEIKTIADSYKRMAEATGENFNIFSLLQVETDEVRTHSRFIAELLNPNGTHNQGDVFLKKFLQSFPQIEDFDTENTRVFVEYYVGKVEKEKGGQIDILLKDTSGNVIMIENKIYAGERANQLLRYKNAFPNGKLFFLTLKGNESNNIKNFEDYIPISYENDIVNWLEECKKEAVNIPTLRETISQYINLIKKLTHQNLNKKMNKEIINRILKDEETFLVYKTVIGVHNELYKEVLQTDFIGLLEEIAKENQLELEFDSGFLEGKIYKGFRLSNETLKQKNLTIRFDYQGANFKSPLLGFNYINNQNINKADYTEIIEKFNNVFGTAITTSNNFACYFWYNELSNINNLNVLQKLKYGNLKENIKDKISKMLEIVQ